MSRTYDGVAVVFHDGGAADGYDSVASAISDVLSLWWEEPGPTVATVYGLDGRPAAALSGGRGRESSGVVVSHCLDTGTVR
jgi:hypothetical protein